MNRKKEYGNIYEIKLPNDKYIYICWIREFSFGIFNYISKDQTDFKKLLHVGFKAYKACKETAIKKKIWKLIGHIDLDMENIEWPDLVVFMAYDKKSFIERSIVMRNGSPLKVSKEEYLVLLSKGYIYGFFDNYLIFERWLSGNIEHYPENQNIFPLSEI